MITTSWLILIGGRLISGVMAELLGIGGGVVLVPLLVTLGNTSVQAVATSNLAIVIISVSGSIQNWWTGYRWISLSLLPWISNILFLVNIHLTPPNKPRNDCQDFTQITRFLSKRCLSCFPDSFIKLCVLASLEKLSGYLTSPQSCIKRKKLVLKTKITMIFKLQPGATYSIDF